MGRSLIAVLVSLSLLGSVAPAESRLAHASSTSKGVERLLMPLMKDFCLVDESPVEGSSTLSKAYGAKTQGDTVRVRVRQGALEPVEYYGKVLEVKVLDSKFDSQLSSENARRSDYEITMMAAQKGEVSFLLSNVQGFYTAGLSMLPEDNFYRRARDSRSERELDIRLDAVAHQIATQSAAGFNLDLLELTAWYGPISECNDLIFNLLNRITERVQDYNPLTARQDPAVVLTVGAMIGFTVATTWTLYADARRAKLNAGDLRRQMGYLLSPRAGANRQLTGPLQTIDITPGQQASLWRQTLNSVGARSRRLNNREFWENKALVGSLARFYNSRSKPTQFVGKFTLSSALSAGAYYGVSEMVDYMTHHRLDPELEIFKRHAHMVYDLTVQSSDLKEFLTDYEKEFSKIAQELRELLSVNPDVVDEYGYYFFTTRVNEKGEKQDFIQFQGKTAHQDRVDALLEKVKEFDGITAGIIEDYSRFKQTHGHLAKNAQSFLGRVPTNSEHFKGEIDPKEFHLATHLDLNRVDSDLLGADQKLRSLLGQRGALERLLSNENWAPTLTEFSQPVELVYTAYGHCEKGTPYCDLITTLANEYRVARAELKAVYKEAFLMNRKAFQIRDRISSQMQFGMMDMSGYMELFALQYDINYILGQLHELAPRSEHHRLVARHLIGTQRVIELGAAYLGIDF
jgi:hypothetical protein